MGKDGFNWFIGVIESRQDPEHCGRVRVRCLGHHTDDTNLIPTADLPWAHVMMPVTAGANSGIGFSPHFLLEGTWVVGFFRDPAMQEPVVMGALPGRNNSVTTDFTIASSSETGGQSKKGGFKDPAGKYPLELYINSVDTNLLAQNDPGDTSSGHDYSKQTQAHPSYGVKGGAEIRSHLGAYFRITYKSNRIRIINLFNRKPPLRMFSYIGNLNIIRCQIMSYDGTFLKANITRNNELLKIQNQKTKVEDDTLIIREGVESEQIFPIKTGLKKIPKGRILRKSNVVERIDINQILTSITKPGKIRTDIETQPRARETVPVEKAVRKELRTKTSTKDSEIKGGGY